MRVTSSITLATFADHILGLFYFPSSIIYIIVSEEAAILKQDLEEAFLRKHSKEGINSIPSP